MTPIATLAHDLANKLQAVTGFLCIKQYDRAQQSAREASEILEKLQLWIMVLEALEADVLHAKLP